MLLSAQPSKVQVPFANSGTKNTIPVPSQIGVTPGAASFTDGFPPLTFTSIEAGGVPPAGADFNGVLHAITQIQRWQCGGGLFTYDSAWSTANGGYPKGALLLKASGAGYWINASDGNTTNPDSGGAGWQDAAAFFFGRSGHTYGASDWAWLDKTSGLIVQWGVTASSTSEGARAVTFPTAFPNACLMVVGTPDNTDGVTFGGDSDNYAQIGAFNASGATLYVNNASTTTIRSTAIYWFAIGR